LLDLPGRGGTFVREVTGPRGAPALVLLHGISVNADVNWFRSYAALGEHFRVLAIDHRGHGRGIAGNGRFRLADCADDAITACEAVGIDRVIAVGYSMGGPIAQLAWHRHRDRVAGLVLCATSGRFVGPEPLINVGAALPRRLARTAGAVRRRRRPAVSDGAGPWLREQMRGTNLRVGMQAGLALSRYDASRWLGDIDVPTAIVLTERDGAVSPARQRALAASIPKSVVFPVAGDHTCCVTRPERFVPVLVEACRHVADRAAASAR
jgi:pimeloyl-ACP methyl ester carboxylesterase